MKDNEVTQLQGSLLRRELTAEEQERLDQHLNARPGEREAWNVDAALSRLLRRLPDAPLSSNFTAQVLQAVEQEPARRWRSFRLFPRWIRPSSALRMAGSAACLVLVFLVYTRYQTASRERMATAVARVVRSVEAASALAQLPPVEVLRDFDAIQGLSQSRAGADEELLVALNSK